MKIGHALRAFAMLTMASAASAQVDVIVTQDYLKMGWEQISSMVPFGDLNLANDAGVATLRQRVKAEANKICGDPSAGAKNKANKDACIESVISSAEPQIVRLAADAKTR
ncbi:MAG: hypothetical protein DI568_02225 [Sphingomonas sp.]|nr:MAG: hypothetical protein DI568_02225 [Sphingomonas sp.]